MLSHMFKLEKYMKTGGYCQERICEDGCIHIKVAT